MDCLVRLEPQQSETGRPFVCSQECPCTGEKTLVAIHRAANIQSRGNGMKRRDFLKLSP